MNPEKIIALFRLRRKINSFYFILFYFHSTTIAPNKNLFHYFIFGDKSPSVCCVLVDTSLTRLKFFVNDYTVLNNNVYSI